MSGETQTLRMNIDASGARRGAAQWVSSLDKIHTATKSFDKMAAQMGKSGKSNGFAAMARQLSALNGIKINPSLAKNVSALSQAMASMRGPNANGVKNIRSLFTALNSAKLNGNTGRSLAVISSSLSTFKGPSKNAATNVRALFTAISGARINAGIANNLAAVSNAMSNFRGMGAGSVRNFQAFVTAVNGLRVPPGISQLGSSLAMLSGRFGSSGSAAIRFGGSVNGIPWGRASQGAVMLTGNLRGLENAMSLSYQMGSQLRVLFGALTVSGFTSSVVEATTSGDRLRVVLGAIGQDVQTINEQMDFASSTANKYGTSLLDVQKEFGRFSASAGATGLSIQQTGFVFESLQANMRLFGLDAAQQTLAIKAVTQMFQKGSVQAEEFKNQLGDQMPGAFEALRRVLVRLTGDANVDPMEMMRKGLLDSDIMIDVMAEMNEMFGKGFGDAAAMAVASMQRVTNSWTKFLGVVGGNGVMKAIGDVSEQITKMVMNDDMTELSPKFQKLAEDIGEGLGNAIRKAGAAAIWLIDNIRTVAQVIGSMLAGKALHTAVQLGSAFGMIGSMVAGTVGKIAGLASVFGRLGAGVSVLGALGAGVGAVGAAFGIAAVVGGTALALLWNETVKLGDATTTVGSMATIAFQDFGSWAQWAGGVIMETFTSLAGVAGQWFNAMNQELTQGTATWEDWAKAVIGVVVLVGNTMIDVFRTAWRLIVQNTLDAFSIIMDTINGIGAAFEMVGKLAAFDTKGAAQSADRAAMLFGRAGKTGENAMKDMGDVIAGTFGNAEQRTADYVAGIDWVSTSWDGSKASMINYFEELARRAAEKDGLNTPVDSDKPFTLPELSDRTGLTPLKGGDEAADALGSIGKAAKSAADAIKAYKEDQAALDAQLASGAITAKQYGEALNFIKGKLEETVDPYAAMIRGMQEENNMLRLNGKEQRLASDFLDRKNQLLEQGISLTEQQTAALKAMIAEQDKLKNPGPLQSWVNNMESASDAIESAGVRAMESLSDNIADMVVDGKADWASLAKTILKDLIKIGLNEVWKGMFGGQQAQQPVNAPLSGALGQQALTSMNMASTENPSVMATAVAQGINLAQGGGLAGFGGLGNDVGAMPGFDQMGVFSGGKADGIGNGAGHFDDFASVFGAGSQQSQASATTNPITQAATAMTGASEAMTSTANAVQSGYQQLDASINNMASNIFGGGAAPATTSAATLPSIGPSGGPSLSNAPMARNNIPANLNGGAMNGVPNMGNAPNIGGMTSSLMGGQSSAGSSGMGSDWINSATNNDDWISRMYAQGRASGLSDAQARLFATQAVQETGWGKSAPGNNYFGIKAGKSWDGGVQQLMTTEEYGGKKVREMANFRAYPSMEEGMIDRRQFMEEKFSVANNAPDFQSAVAGLQHGKYGAYATDSSYASSLNSINAHIDPNKYSSMWAGGSQASMPPGVPGSMQPQGMMGGYGAGMMPGAQAGMMQPSAAAGMGGGAGFGALPGGMGSSFTSLGGGAGANAGGNMGGLGEQFTSEMQSSFTTLGQQFPTSMEPGITQTANLLPQKLSEGEGLGDGLSSALEPANQQAATSLQQNYSQANQQVAQEFAQVMSQAMQSMQGGGMGGLGGQGGGMGGLGSIFGMMGSFFKTGGVIGQGGGSKKQIRSMESGGIIGDPDAEPIIGHKGELVVPAHEVDRMRRMGQDVTLLDDNAAVKTAGRRTNDVDADSQGSGTNGARTGAQRPIVNMTINTPNSDSFRASQGQVMAKAGAAAYRDSVRNH